MLSNIGAVQAQSKEKQECNIEMETISIVLNCYRRTRWFAEQLNAIKNQSIKPIEILVWKNYSPNESISSELTKDLTVVDCNKNLGVWARFSLALNCKGKYICIFDDDTIPGKDWLKNCLDNININDGLLGTVGVKFGDKNYSWNNLNRVGWCNPNNNIQRVDIVGHSWFFKKELLTVFWRELPPENLPLIVGEDIHFAHMIQKYTNLGVYVPPHPFNNKNMWGSLNGENYGHSQEGITMNTYKLNGNQLTEGQLMGAYLSSKVDSGFKLLSN